MYFRDATVLQGQVSLEEAKITGELDLSDARLSDPETDALNCAHLTVGQLSMPKTP
jgi:hypothetical protein